MPNPSSMYWHVVIRSGTPDRTSLLFLTRLEQLKGFVANYLDMVPSPVERYLLQEDVGKRDHNLHWHLHLELCKVVSQNHIRETIKYFITAPKALRTSPVQNRHRSQVYTLKGSLPLFYKKYTDEELDELIKVWVPTKEFKKNGVPHTIEVLRKQIDEKDIQYDDRYSLIKLVLEYYVSKKKGFTDMQIISIVNLLENHDDAVIHNTIQRLYNKMLK